MTFLETLPSSSIMSPSSSQLFQGLQPGPVLASALLSSPQFHWSGIDFSGIQGSSDKAFKFPFSLFFKVTLSYHSQDVRIYDHVFIFPLSIISLFSSKNFLFPGGTVNCEFYLLCVSLGSTRGLKIGCASLVSVSWMTTEWVSIIFK